MPVVLGGSQVGKFINALSKASESLSNASLRLSSGLRINRAADDAAGLAISSSLEVSNRIDTQAIRNINDGLSALNIAGSAISQLSTIVMRVQELAEQSANGTYSAQQRTAMSVEGDALMLEYDRVINTTTFNGIKLLDGSNGSISIQAGSDTQDRYSLTTINANNSLVKINGGFYNAVQSYSISGAEGNQTFSDLNNDGTNDIVTSGGSVLLSNSDGSFLARRTFSVATGYGTAITTGDFNEDGFADIVWNDGGGGGSTDDFVRISFGNGDGTFKGSEGYPVGFYPLHLGTSDFDNDGNLDLAVNNYNDSTIGILLGYGNGTFKVQQAYSGSVPGSLEIRDINGDSLEDLVVRNYGDNRNDIYFGNADGSFKARTLLSQYVSTAPAFGDFNSDGVIDAVIATTTALNIHIGSSDGTFSGANPFTTSGTTDALKSADADRDGKSDVIRLDSSTARLLIYSGNGNNTFKSPLTLTTQASPSFLSVDDFNRDGRADLTVTSANEVRIWSSFSLGSKETALSALNTLNAIATTLGLLQGEIGAQMSRLNTGINVVSTRREANRGAQSRILDADVAQEAAEMVRTTILQQGSTAILGIASQQPQLALLLLS